MASSIESLANLFLETMCPLAISHFCSILDVCLVFRLLVTQMSKQPWPFDLGPFPEDPIGSILPVLSLDLCVNSALYPKNLTAKKLIVPFKNGHELAENLESFRSIDVRPRSWIFGPYQCV